MIKILLMIGLLYNMIYGKSHDLFIPQKKTKTNKKNIKTKRNLMYIGSGLYLIGSKTSNITTNSKEIDLGYGYGGGLNGGVILSPNSKLNIFYYKTFRTYKSISKRTESIGFSYDYCFNFKDNYHNGIFIGIGLSQVTNYTDIKKYKIPVYNSFGALGRIGYEYMYRNKYFFHSAINISSVKQDYKLKDKAKKYKDNVKQYKSLNLNTKTHYIDISMSYIF